MFGSFSGMYFAILLTLESKKNTPSVFHLSPRRTAPLSTMNHKQELQVQYPTFSEELEKKKKEKERGKQKRDKKKKTQQATQASLSEWQSKT